MSKRGNKPKQQTKSKLDLQANNHYPRGVEKVPTPSKPHGQARRKTQQKLKSS
jgi:hypothetical protein